MTLREKKLGRSVPMRSTVFAFQLVVLVLRGSDIQTIFRRFLHVFKLYAVKSKLVAKVFVTDGFFTTLTVKICST